MNLHYLNRFILGTALTLALVACGGSQTKPAADRPAPIKTTAADALAVEALATYHLQRDGSRAWALISEATKQAPSRIDLAFLQMRLCELIEGCQPEAYEARMRKLDSGNAAVWMRALADAQRQRQPMVEAQIIEAMGRAQRFDVYWNSLVATLASVRIANGGRPDMSLNETIQWVGSAVVPALHPITAACSRLRTAELQWTERCMKVARVLMNGDTNIVDNLGTKLAQQVTSDSAEQIKLAEHWRASRYRWRTHAEISSSQIEKDKFALELLELMRKLRREQDVILAVVRWSGRPITPSPAWTDEGL